MIKGLYTSISGLAAADARQQVLASNLANVNTPGYKGDDVTTQSFDQVFTALFDPVVPGTGAVTTVGEADGRRLDLSQGGFTQTGAALDLALDGAGLFALQGPNGTLYTRAGRFTRDAAGTLRSPDGLAVLGTTGQPITARGDDVRVQADGTVLSDGAVAGRLQIAAFDPGALTRAGTTTFTAAGAPVAATARVVSGALENANVDATSVMTAMMLLLRAFEAGRQVVQIQNETLGATVNQIGSLR
jgi:flagellar basal-body rod protein FlgF